MVLVLLIYKLCAERPKAHSDIVKYSLSHVTNLCGIFSFIMLIKKHNVNGKILMVTKSATAGCQDL